MASNNQIVKKSIQIDAGDTVRTVKSLKQEISDLRDELLNLEKGTEEYDEVQKQLQEDVEDLNEVMGAHKEKAETLEGSYNDLQNQLKELKAAWKATNDEAERDSLGQKINELNNQLKEMDASIGDFHRNVGNYQSSWEGLTGVMDKGGLIADDLEKGIKAFGAALGMSDKQVNALSKSLKGLKDGFKIAKDITKAQEESTKLATAEAEAATQGTALAASQKATGASAKVMAAGETTAAGATKGLSVAMRGLKTALISTGIGALIVALGSLIGKLDEAREKLRLGRAEAEEDYKPSSQAEKIRKQFEEEEKALNRTIRIMEAEGKTEKEILDYRKKFIEDHLSFASAMTKTSTEIVEKEQELLDDQNKKVKKLVEDVGMALGGPLFKLLNRWAGDKLVDVFNGSSEAIEDFGQAAETSKEMLEDYQEKLEDINTDIEIFNLKQKRGTEELTKWAEAVKDPAFQKAWSDLFKLQFPGNNPTEVIKAQRDAALALLKQLKVESSGVENMFNGLISGAEAEWQSLVEKEQAIFDERLTPAQRLENEKAEWVRKANTWGMDATEIVKYYDKKIQEQLDKDEEERQEKLEQADAKRLAEIEKYLQEVDATLATNEKLDALFNPMFIQNTAAGDIQQEIDAIKRLYDTQMAYLNNLLESADLTEEAYAGVEERILELTATFNAQMKVLKEEQDYQGKNFALLSRKWVANTQLMGDAMSDFSSAFQSLGLENSAAFKAFASAQALISAFLAANRVLAEEPGELIIKIAAASAALAAGIANVAAIWSVNPDGSNATGAMSAQMPSATPVIGNAQPINYYRNVTEASPEDEMNKYNIVVRVTDIEDGLNEKHAQVSNSSF